MQCCAIFAGNDSYGLWEPWNGSLARFLEQPFGHQTIISLFVGLLKIADAARAHLKHIELIIPARRIDRQPPTADDLHANVENEVEHAGFPEDGGNLFALIFQSPIPGAGAMVYEIRD